MYFYEANNAKIYLKVSFYNLTPRGFVGGQNPYNLKVVKYEIFK